MSIVLEVVMRKLGRLTAAVGLALSVLLAVGAAPALATSMVGPSWVPGGQTACWQIDDWDFPVDVSWGDGKSGTEVSQPFCHSYRTKGSFTITATRFDIDVGTIVLGRMTVATQVPTFGGPYAPGTSDVVTPIAGQQVEFRFTAPGPYDTAWFGVDGAWSEATGTTFATSFASEGSHSVGLRMAVAGWVDDYTRSITVDVGPAPTTTTSSTTTTTVAPTTTTTVDASDQTTTTTTLAVVAPGSDAPVTEDPPTTTLDPMTATTVPETGGEERLGDAAAADDSEEPEEEPQLVFDTPQAPLTGGSSGSPLPMILGIVLVAGGLAGAAFFGYSLVSRHGTDMRPWTTTHASAADGAVADDMAVPPTENAIADDMAVPPDQKAIVDDMVRRPSRGAWVPSLGIAGSLGIAIIGFLVLANGGTAAEAADEPDVLATARNSDLFVREFPAASLGDRDGAGNAIVLTRSGAEVRLEDFVDASSLATDVRTRDLFTEETRTRYLDGPPKLEETVVELEDRFVVDRVADVVLKDGACDDETRPDALAELCFDPKDDPGPITPELRDELAAIRERLDAGKGGDVVAGGVTVDRARGLSDAELLGLLVNSGTKRVRHTSVVPTATAVDTSRPRGPRNLADLSTAIPSAPVASTGWVLLDITQATTDVQWSGTPESEDREYFLTGFTLGEEIEDSWEFVIAEESVWHDKWYLKLDYLIGYGFGLRAPFAVDVQHERTSANSKQVAVSVSPVNVASDGSPAYQAVGLPSGKYFGGDEFVLELRAKCHFYASIPGPDLEQDCPDVAFDKSRDIPPVLGAERSSVETWWIDGKTTGLWLDAGFASAQIDTGVGLDVTNGTFTVDVAPLSGSVLSGLDRSSLGFSSRAPRTFTVTREQGLQGGFALSSPRSTFTFSLQPAVRAKVGVDISYYENEWTLGPWSIPISVDLLTIPLPHHAGTVSSHEYSIFGIDGVTTPTAPISTQDN